jgi:hypothetical protein
MAKRKILPKLLVNYCGICGKEIDDQEEPLCLNCFLHYEGILTEIDLLYCCSCLDEFFYCEKCKKRLKKIHDYLDSYADYYLIGLKCDSAYDEYFFLVESNNDDYILDYDQIEHLYDNYEIEYKKLEGIEKILILKRIELYYIRNLDGELDERIKMIKDSYVSKANDLVVYRLVLTPIKQAP